MKKLQKGFTLIEMMIVLVIIGIMAAFALPKFQEYIAKAQVAEGIQMATNAKISITDNLQNRRCIDPYVEANNTVTGRYAQLVISEDESKDKSPDVATNTNGCVVTITYGRGVDSSGKPSGVSRYINNQTLVLNMLHNGSYQIDDTTTLPMQYRPKSIAPVPDKNDNSDNSNAQIK
ncbi:MAG: prepilin-type N-terminal cleavage/methylation domain-containing protein [Neisseriaceae bacterium]|nr:MAG: prepilin-type N-terminal cleavage/methylation domain-containing protein [Neisseriaceae bacterium]